MPKVAHSPGAPTGRAGRGRRVATSLAEINVVPLVDVMLVLLIIFMVTAPMLQRGIDVKLPVSRRATQIPATEQRVDVVVPADYRTARSVVVNKKPVKADDLREIIRQQMENRARKEVFLRGDRTVQYQDLMEVFDALKAAGVENVGMVAALPGER
jgi:biopolymer transport protein TolR